MASLITTIKGSQIDLPAFDGKTFVLHGRHFYSNNKTLRGARSGGAAEWILTSKIFHAYLSQCRKLRQPARTDASASSRLRPVPSFRAMSRSSEACFPSVAHSPAVRTQNLDSQDQQNSAAGCVTCTPLLKSNEKKTKNEHQRWKFDGFLKTLNGRSWACDAFKRLLPYVGRRHFKLTKSG